VDSESLTDLLSVSRRLALEKTAKRHGNAIFARQDAVGNSLGDVTTILQGRLIRLAFQMKF
jgi:hypothetical protein